MLVHARRERYVVMSGGENPEIRWYSRRLAKPADFPLQSDVCGFDSLTLRGRASHHEGSVRPLLKVLIVGTSPIPSSPGEQALIFRPHDVGQRDRWLFAINNPSLAMASHLPLPRASTATGEMTKEEHRAAAAIQVGVG